MANAFHRLKFKDPFPGFAAILKAVKLLGGDPAGDERQDFGGYACPQFHQNVTATAVCATIMDGATLPCLAAVTSHTESFLSSTALVSYFVKIHQKCK